MSNVSAYNKVELAYIGIMVDAWVVHGWKVSQHPGVCSSRFTSLHLVSPISTIVEISFVSNVSAYNKVELAY